MKLNLIYFTMHIKHCKNVYTSKEKEICFLKKKRKPHKLMTSKFGDVFFCNENSNVCLFLKWFNISQFSGHPKNH